MFTTFLFNRKFTNYNILADVRLSWEYTLQNSTPLKVKHYELGSKETPGQSDVKTLGCINPMPLPMACTLNNLSAGQRFVK